MKKIASNGSENSPEQMDLTKSFWRWFSLSVLALLVAAAIPALSADVFIDEGDGDFAATPVSTPTADPVADKKPASVDKAPASDESGGAGMDLDAEVGDLEHPADAPPAAAGPSDITGDLAPPIEEKPVEKKKSAPKAEKASKKKSAAKAGKKKDKKKKGAKAGKKADKKKDKKKKSSKKSKKESMASNGKSSKRKVAAATSFAGGQYATTSKDCSMESSPGAGDSVGTAKASRKLWVEDSGNTSYWKVYGKSGSAAFVSRDCF